MTSTVHVSVTVSPSKVSKSLGHIFISDWPLVQIHLNVCVLLDIFGRPYLREMHGKWPVHGHLLFLALTQEHVRVG